MNKPYHDALNILAKAEDAVQTAVHDLSGGFFLATANRTY